MGQVKMKPIMQLRKLTMGFVAGQPGFIQPQVSRVRMKPIVRPIESTRRCRATHPISLLQQRDDFRDNHSAGRGSALPAAARFFLPRIIQLCSRSNGTAAPRVTAAHNA